MSEAEAMMADALDISEVMRSSAFWVMLTMVSFLLALIMHSYWTNCAHKRLDALRSDLDEMKKECDRIKAEMKEINERNPFTFIRKVNP